MEKIMKLLVYFNYSDSVLVEIISNNNPSIAEWHYCHWVVLLDLIAHKLKNLEERRRQRLSPEFVLKC
jgi:hypothetical protein